MSPDHETYLIKTYPKIFRQRYLSPKETCMCWGFECGDGWFQLIAELCKAIQAHVDAGHCEQIEATQVKEKYGGLRFYINGGDDYVLDLIDAAENMSEQTCEVCGATDNVTQSGGWIVTMCKKCTDSVQQ